MELNWLTILFRWMHLIAACALAGSTLLYYLVFSPGKPGPEPEAPNGVDERARRRFKLTVHISLLLFLVSGTFNALKNWPIYTERPGLMHGMFGMHLLLGLGAITLLMITLAGRRPVRSAWVRWALIAMVLGIAAASTLKSAREWTMLHPLIRVQASSPASQH